MKKEAIDLKQVYNALIASFDNSISSFNKTDRGFDQIVNGKKVANIVFGRVLNDYIKRNKLEDANFPAVFNKILQDATMNRTIGIQVGDNYSDLKPKMRAALKNETFEPMTLAMEIYDIIKPKPQPALAPSTNKVNYKKRVESRMKKSK